MKKLLTSAEFRAELPGWALRGVLCASTSAFWAVLMGFQAPAEIAGMVLGVAGWVAVFAAGCAWLQRSPRWQTTSVVAAIKWAAWIKIGLTAGCWLVYLGASAIGFKDMAMLGLIDTLLGLFALMLVSFLAGMTDPETVATLDSLGWTALTTMTEGWLMTLVIAGIAALVWGCWQVRDALQKRRVPYAD